MRLENYIEGKPILNENVFTNMLNKIKNQSKKTLENLFKKSWLKMAAAFKEAGIEDKVLTAINSKMNTNFRSLDQISKLKIQESNEINEDWSHFWKIIGSEGFTNLKFWPALSVWLILGNTLLEYLKGTTIDPTDIKAAAIYGVIWIALASGQFVKNFKKWKKENPDEYYAERPELAKKHGYKFQNPKLDPNYKTKVRAGFV